MDFCDLENCELSDSDYFKIDSILTNCISEYNLLKKSEYKINANQFLLKELSYYDRQYICIKNKNNEKEVYINCFPTGFDKENWKNELIIVKDGGPNFFEVKINLNTGNYYELFVNGFG